MYVNNQKYDHIFLPSLRTCVATLAKVTMECLRLLLPMLLLLLLALPASATVKKSPSPRGDNGGCFSAGFPAAAASFSARRGTLGVLGMTGELNILEIDA